VAVAPGIRRVVARNPTKFTGWGTGTYVIGEGDVAVVDPGPDDPAHVDALLAGLAGETVRVVLVTHTHADHSPATAALVARTGATTYGFGPHPPGADDGGEEHGDRRFTPDVALRDGDVVEGPGFRVEALHTPGHISNHLCFAERTRGVLLTGDHVMGWSTTVIPPPDGRVADYLASLRRLLDRTEARYLPTHGPPIDDPVPYVAALLEHRLDRERQILAELSAAPRTIAELVATLYADVRAELHEPAARSVRAHLVKLVEEGRASAEPEGDEERYRPA
jgi:glyoxylase-like metal-dependent hydrolase (beta-lactamase superfamily II)